MTNRFIEIPDTPVWHARNARIPADLLAAPPTLPMHDGLVACDIEISGGVVSRIAPPGNIAGDCAQINLRDGLVLPRFVDMHTHIDKGHILARSPNPDGTFFGARSAVMTDREGRWSAEDVTARMDFALRCAFAHGTGALRTHIDSLGRQAAISWPVLSDIRDAWKGRIAIQAVALFPTIFAVDDPRQFNTLAATVARHGGILGGLTFMGDAPDAKLSLALDRVFAAATAHGLDLDFHVDESDSPDATSLEALADAALRHRFRGRIVAGHCCRLALDDDEGRRRVIEKLAEARIAVVSLPMCNMYLQDRARGRTPRWRGIAPLHELDAAGVAVAVASDNTRDAFYAYGDLDMLEVFREATRIAQLDHTTKSWTRLLGSAPADILGLDAAGRIGVGRSADLVLVNARTVNELNCRPQSDRVVVVAGKASNAKLPDYRELDRLMV